jgi:hypothetical protein
MLVDRDRPFGQLDIIRPLPNSTFTSTFESAEPINRITPTGHGTARCVAGARGRRVSTNSGSVVSNNALALAIG